MLHDVQRHPFLKRRYLLFIFLCRYAIAPQLWGNRAGILGAMALGVPAASNRLLRPLGDTVGFLLTASMTAIGGDEYESFWMQQLLGGIERMPGALRLSLDAFVATGQVAQVKNNRFGLPCEARF